MPFEKANIKHHNLTEKEVSKITLLFDELVSQVAMYVSAVTLDKKIFKFNLFPTIKKKVDKLLQKHAFTVTTQIENGVAEHWNLSQKNNESFIKNLFKKHNVRKPIPTRNIEGLNAFRNRKNRVISKRVWKQTEQLRQELEMAIDTAVKQGTPANKLATELKKYLKEPDRLHRRYRDNNGQLQLSKNAKAYSPGQGVYRSSYKNAQRLARTEINKAYRLADIDKWSKTDSTIGYEIKRSKHPYPCKICDMMAGKYPKNFIWSGNHPNCRCYLVPILISDADFVNGVTPNQITKVNPKLTRWVNENTDKLTKSKSLPTYLSDNKTFFDVNTKLKTKFILDDLKLNSKILNKDTSISLLSDPFGFGSLRYLAEKLSKSRTAKKFKKEQNELFEKLLEYKTLKKYDNGGKVIISNLVDIESSDFDKVFKSCEFFAKQGYITEILPRFNSPLKNEIYKKLYKGLENTKYWGKCPDFKVGNKYFEHEGVKNGKPKRALSNMLSRGLKQSNYLVIDKVDFEKKYLMKLIKFRINQKIVLEELWILDNGNLYRFYP